MAISSSPFKSYDIRGLVGEQITPDFVHDLGEALYSVIRPTRVLVGHDMRDTSSGFARQLIEKFLKKGVDCVEIGLCTTTVFYNAMASREDVDLGIMVTASHNPAEYNGFKICKSRAVPIGAGSGMEEIERAWFNKEQYNDSLIQKPGRLERVPNAVGAYLNKVVAELPGQGALLKGLAEGALKMVVDAGNGMAGLTLPILAQRFPGFHLTPLYWELDGTFPHHEANPLHTETLNELRQRVVEEGAAIGFAFDGDGDRIGVVDEQGSIVPGDILTALLAREVLGDTLGGLVLYDLRSSWSVKEEIEKVGGRAEMCRVGHAHIKRQMRDEGALFAGELSMHFYFAAFGYCEASEYTMLLILSLLQRTGQPMSALWRPFLKYAHSGERNFRLTEASETVLARLQARYAKWATATSTIDGLRYEFLDPAHAENDWWFSVRASNTEPLLRLNLETRSMALTELKVKELECGILGSDGAALSTI